MFDLLSGNFNNLNADMVLGLITTPVGNKAQNGTSGVLIIVQVLINQFI